MSNAVFSCTYGHLFQYYKIINVKAKYVSSSVTMELAWFLLAFMAIASVNARAKVDRVYIYADQNKAGESKQSNLEKVLEQNWDNRLEWKLKNLCF